MFCKLQSQNSQVMFETLFMSLCPHFETNVISNRTVIELLVQLKSAKDHHGKNYIKVKPLLVRHLLRNRLLSCSDKNLAQRKITYQLRVQFNAKLKKQQN